MTDSRAGPPHAGRVTRHRGGPRLSSKEGSGLLQGPPAGRATEGAHVGGMALRAGGTWPGADLVPCAVTLWPPRQLQAHASQHGPQLTLRPPACASPGVSAGSWVSPGLRAPPGRWLEGARRAAKGQPPAERSGWRFHSVDSVLAVSESVSSDLCPSPRTGGTRENDGSCDRRHS